MPTAPSGAPVFLPAGRAGPAAKAGVDRTDRLLKQLTKTVLEAALNAEMTEHLGHAKHQAEPGQASGNVRNGTRSKMVVSDAVGEVEIATRDWDASSEPVIVKKR